MVKLKDILSEIIIGPNNDISRCTSSVQRLLDSNGLGNVKIKQSVIPYIQ